MSDGTSKEANLTWISNRIRTIVDGSNYIREYLGHLSYLKDHSDLISNVLETFLERNIRPISKFYQRYPNDSLIPLLIKGFSDNNISAEFLAAMFNRFLVLLKKTDSQ